MLLSDCEAGAGAQLEPGQLFFNVHITLLILVLDTETLRGPQFPVVALVKPTSLFTRERVSANDPATANNGVRTQTD